MRVVGIGTTLRGFRVTCITRTTIWRLSCMAVATMMRLAMSGTVARSGMATTPGRQSEGWERPGCSRSRRKVWLVVVSCSTWLVIEANLHWGKVRRLPHEDLEACAASQGTKIESRDIL